MLDKARYRYVILLTIFLIVSGACFIGISREHSEVDITRNRTVTTEDGVTIYYDVYEPKNNDSPKYGVIVGHGFTASKESMHLTALTLAESGFVVANLDFRGHGRSGGTLGTGSPENTYELARDILAVKTYLDARDDVIHGEYGIIGHSMGGRAAFSACVEDDSFTSMVGIAPAVEHDFIEEDRPEDLLIISARYDTLFPPEVNRRVISKRHDLQEDHVEYDRRYETDGTASKISVIDNADHLTVLWASSTHREINRWFADPYGVHEGRVATSRMNIYTIIGLLSAASASMTLIHLVHGDRGDDKTRVNTDLFELSRDHFLYSFLFTIPAFIIFSPLLLLPTTNTAMYIMILGGSFLGTAYLLRKRIESPLKESIKRYLTNSGSDYIYGGIYGFTLLAIVRVFVSDHYLNLTLISTRFVYFILTAVILFFFFSVDNIFFFDLLDNDEPGKLSTARSIALYSSFKSIYVVTIMVAAGLLAMSSYYMIPYAVGLFVMIGTCSVLIHRKSGSKIIPSVAVSILTASIFVSVTAIFDPISMIL